MPDQQEPRDQPGVLRAFHTRDQTRAYYDKISRVYDLIAERSEAPLRRRGLELLAVQEGETVLEIGCGTGTLLPELARAVGPEGGVHGLDLSPGMLDQARGRLESEGLSGRVILDRGDAAALPYADGSFDGACMSFTLELFDTPEIPRVLAECARCLRPRGRLVVVGLSREGDEDPMRKLYEWAHRHFPNFIDCRPIFVRRALESAGFEILRVQLEHMWVPVEIVLARRPGQGSGDAG